VAKLFLKHIRRAIYAPPPPLNCFAESLRNAGLPEHDLPSDLPMVTARNPSVEIVKPGSKYNCYDVEGMSDEQFHEHQKKNKTAALNFVDGQGFRRVGFSALFAYSNASSNPSRSLKAIDDIERREAPASLDETPTRRAERFARLRREQPLKYAICITPDLDFLTQIRTKYPVQYKEWDQSDRLADNLLHHAAISSLPRSTYWIIPNINPKYKLSMLPNCSTYTTLEFYQKWHNDRRIGWGWEEEMETSATPKLTHDTFEGYQTRLLKSLLPSIILIRYPLQMYAASSMAVQMPCVDTSCHHEFVLS